MVRGDLDSNGMADPLINFSQVFNRNGHHVGFCGLHLIAFFVGGGNRSGSLLIIHETVRKLMDAICIWLFCGEIQSIKMLDAGIVKAFSIFALTIDLAITSSSWSKLFRISSMYLWYSGVALAEMEPPWKHSSTADTLCCEVPERMAQSRTTRTIRRGKDSHNRPQPYLLAGLH